MLYKILFLNAQGAQIAEADSAQAVRDFYNRTDYPNLRIQSVEPYVEPTLNLKLLPKPSPHKRSR